MPQGRRAEERTGQGPPPWLPPPPALAVPYQGRLLCHVAAPPLPAGGFGLVGGIEPCSTAQVWPTGQRQCSLANTAMELHGATAGARCVRQPQVTVGPGHLGPSSQPALYFLDVARHTPSCASPKQELMGTVLSQRKAQATGLSRVMWMSRVPCATRDAQESGELDAMEPGSVKRMPSC